MRTDLYPLQVLLVTLAGWVNRHQQHVIEYLIEENRVLKGQLIGQPEAAPLQVFGHYGGGDMRQEPDAKRRA